MVTLKGFKAFITLVIICSPYYTIHSNNSWKNQLQQHKLWAVVANQNEKGVKHYLAKGIDPNFFFQQLNATYNFGKPRDPSAFTPLKKAVQLNNFEIVKLLLAAGAKPSLSNKLGESAIFIAAYNGNIKITKLLIESGAKVNVKTRNQWSPIMYAYRNNKKKMVDLLISNGDKTSEKYTNITRYFGAIKRGNIDTVNKMLDLKVSVKSLDQYKDPAIIIAVINNQPEIVDLLLQKDAKIVNQTTSKVTPLMFASSQGYTDILSILLKYEAPVNTKDKNGWTALHYFAQYQNNPKTIAIFISNGANIDSTEKNGFTPFHISVMEKNYRVALELIKNNANVDYRIKRLKGQTLLMLLCYKGDKTLKVVSFLLKNGADPNYSVNGMTAVDIATKSRNNKKLLPLMKKYSSK